MSKNVGIILLAAGESGRLGSPKQLLPYKGQGLLRHVMQEAINSEASPVVVVLGANKGLIETQINQHKAKIVENSEWREGITSSIRCGIAAIQRIDPYCEAVILLACDQPNVDAGLLNQLIGMHRQSNSPVVASSYGNITGLPVLFHHSLFPELLQLSGDSEGDQLITPYTSQVKTVSFPGGIIDINTAEDYNAINA